MISGAFDKESLINSMANIDNFVTDNSPVVDKFFKQYDAKFYRKSSGERLRVRDINDISDLKKV